MFANLLDGAVGDRLPEQADYGLARAVARDDGARVDAYDRDREDRTDAARDDEDMSDDAAADDDGADSDAAARSRDAGPADRPADRDNPTAHAGASATAFQNDLGRASNGAASAVTAGDPAAIAAGADETGSAPNGLTVQPNAASSVTLAALDPGGGRPKQPGVSAAEGARPGGGRALVTGPGNGAGGRPGGDGGNPHGAAAAGAAENRNFAPKLNAGQTLPEQAFGKPAGDGSQPPLSPVQQGLGKPPGAAGGGRSDGPPSGPGAALAASDPAALSASEERTLFTRLSARRAAELHHSRVRLAAHRTAIRQAAAQSGSSGTPQGDGGHNINRVSVEFATAPAASSPVPPQGSPLRLGSGFNAVALGNLGSQTASDALAGTPVGDAAGSGAEPSSTATERQAFAPTANRGPGLRAMPWPLPLPPATQIKVHIQNLVKSGADRIQVQLSPATLGRVSVELELSPDKTVQAIVYAEKPETLDLLERDARLLQRAFEDAGLKFDSNSLAFQQGHADASNRHPAEAADGPGPSAQASTDEAAGEGDTTDQIAARKQHDGMLDLEI